MSKVTYKNAGNAGPDHSELVIRPHAIDGIVELRVLDRTGSSASVRLQLNQIRHLRDWLGKQAAPPEPEGLIVESDA